MLTSTVQVQGQNTGPDPTDPREALLLRLRGQTVHLPNLKPIFADWTGIYSRNVSPWVDSLRQKVRERLRCFAFDAAKQKRLEAADFALFTGLWWPEAPFEWLQTLVCLAVWLFTWDDEIDEPTGSCSDDFSAAQTYRDYTLKLVAHSLGLFPHETRPQPRNQIIQSFDVIGEALRMSYTVSQCQLFYQEIKRFMAASEEEQRSRLDKRIPALQEYWNFRLGTSVVYIGTAAGEYSMSSHLPLEIMSCEAMRAVWDETNIIISITNDLLSLKKEIKLGCIDSIVPLTFMLTGNVRSAIRESITALQTSQARFNDASNVLLSEIKDSETRQQVARFLETQRNNCVGNLVWSLETQRYGMDEFVNQDGTQSFTL